jgi:hypothetical protein
MERLYHEMMERVMPYLTPAEQSVYHRLFYLTHVQGVDHVSIRYEDLARACNISFSGIQRIVKTLKAKKLLKTTWQQKSTTTFVVLITPLSPRPSRRAPHKPSVYDSFSPDDRELFLTCKRAMNPRRLTEIEKEAADWLADRYEEYSEDFLRDKIDEFIMGETFGPARTRKYEPLFMHLYRGRCCTNR